MKAFLFTIIALLSFYHPEVSAQVRLNINLHQVSEMEVVQDIKCERISRDITVSFEMNTFLARTDSFLRMEVMDLDQNKNYILNHNNLNSRLTSNRPYKLIVLKKGSQNHKVKLTVLNTPISFCEELEDNLRLTIEPM